MACPWAVALKRVFRAHSARIVAKSLIFGNHGKGFIRSTRPPQNCVSDLPCPNCGSELAFLAQYQRQYCYSCGRYAPDGFGDRGAKRCPTCTGILSYVTQYERYYCHRCNAYPPEGMFMETPASTPPPTWLEPIAASPSVVVILEPPKVEEKKPTTVEVPRQPAPQPEELTAEEIPPEEPLAPVAKPELIRDEIREAKKPTLMDLCRAYDLDPTGTKEQLRERLLSYLDELEAEDQPEELEGESHEAGPEDIRGEERPHEEPTQIVTSIGPTFEPETSHPIVEAEPQILGTTEEAQAAPLPSAMMSPASVEPRPVQTVLEPFVTSVVIEPPTREVGIPEPSPVPLVRAEHPCPTCGRELTYVSRYDRWYCYSCRAYAPRAKAKFACPNCGASLRWITQYERWWCDSCRRYAPADLPKPEQAGARTRAIAPTVTESAAAIASTVVHRHRSPGSGIGLLGFGMVLFVVYEILVDLPVVLAVNTGVSVAPDIAFGLRFFGLLFVAVGAILGLYAVRDRR